MDQLGAPELLVILVIVILVFGVGRIGKVGTELGQGLRAFREGLNGPKEAKQSLPAKDAPPQARTVASVDNDRTYEQ